MSESTNHPWPRPAGEAEVRDVLFRSRGGDLTALAELRTVLDQNPQIWRDYGNLAAHARDAWIRLIAGTDLVLKESLVRQVEAMQTELAGPAPSPLETLLIERIGATWLQVAYSDAAVAQAGDISLKQAEHARKRQDSAHRRYLQAIATLATVRRLLPPAGVTASPRLLTNPED